MNTFLTVLNEYQVLAKSYTLSYKVTLSCIYTSETTPHCIIFTLKKPSLMAQCVLSKATGKAVLII